ncbi:putative PurR-regulated permease PerM [Nitrobacteraceae bacterium AZCC 2146]
MTDPRPAQEKIREMVLRDDPGGQPNAAERRSPLTTGLVLLAASICLFLIWQTASSLLIIFAGVLFAAFLDASARALASVLPVNKLWRLTLVVLLLAAALTFGLIWGAGKLPEQTRLLIKVMDEQLDVLQEHLLSFGVDLLGPEGGRNLSKWFFADQSTLLSHAMPLVAIGRVAVIRFYVEDCLGDDLGSRPMAVNSP